jgi:hypothetical protein
MRGGGNNALAYFHGRGHRVPPPIPFAFARGGTTRDLVKACALWLLLVAGQADGGAGDDDARAGPAAAGVDGASGDGVAAGAILVQ